MRTSCSHTGETVLVPFQESGKTSLSQRGNLAYSHWQGTKLRKYFGGHFLGDIFWPPWSKKWAHFQNDWGAWKSLYSLV